MNWLILSLISESTFVQDRRRAVQQMREGLAHRVQLTAASRRVRRRLYDGALCRGRCRPAEMFTTDRIGFHYPVWHGDVPVQYHPLRTQGMTKQKSACMNKPYAE